MLPLPKFHTHDKADVSAVNILPEKFKTAGMHAPTLPAMAILGLFTTLTWPGILNESIQPDCVATINLVDYISRVF